MTTRSSGRGWAYFGAILGGAVSIAANVAHSYVPPTGATGDWSPQPGAVVGAIFWPLALFVAVEILTRVQWPTGPIWTLARYAGLLPVALVAAVVSYRHLSGLLNYYGEDPLTVAIGPVAVDGLMVMATSALLATGAHTTNPATIVADTNTPALLVDVDEPTPDDTPATVPAVVDEPDTTPADPVVTPEPEPTPAPAVQVVDPEPIQEPAPVPVTVPTHLLPAARFAVVQHEQSTGNPITSDQLAARLNITPAIAGGLLAEIRPAHINGTPVGAA
jgi:hypothetical protein